MAWTNLADHISCGTRLSVSSPLHLLLLEDSEDEALSLVRELSRHGYTLAWERVDTAEALQAALARGSWDVVICDYSQQRLRLRAAFEILQSSGQDLPFIILRGGAEDETADEVMGGAAHGYVSKDNLASLPAVIEKQLQHAAGRRCSAERDGRNNDGLFRSIFQNALAGMATVSPEGRFLQVNPAFAGCSVTVKIYCWRNPSLKSPMPPMLPLPAI